MIHKSRFDHRVDSIILGPNLEIFEYHEQIHGHVISDELHNLMVVGAVQLPIIEIIDPSFVMEDGRYYIGFTGIYASHVKAFHIRNKMVRKLTEDRYWHDLFTGDDRDINHAVITHIDEECLVDKNKYVTEAGVLYYLAKNWWEVKGKYIRENKKKRGEKNE